MKGDYLRYMAEVEINKESSLAETMVAKDAGEAYQQAYDLARNKLATTNPIRLGLALNLSVFYFEILNDHAQACSLAKSAFDEAINDLDQLSEDKYKDATVIMQLLRDNL